MPTSPRPATDAPLTPAAAVREPGIGRAPLDGAAPRAATTETIGEAGGIVRAGAYILVVPPFALDFPVTITLRAEPGGALTFEPEGLEFAVPACLVRGYGERAPQLSFLRALRVRDLLTEPDALPSLDTRYYAKVFASLRCCSSYMAAE
jgi:hypothetical protein